MHGQSSYSMDRQRSRECDSTVYHRAWDSGARKSFSNVASVSSAGGKEPGGNGPLWSARVCVTPVGGGSISAVTMEVGTSGVHFPGGVPTNGESERRPWMKLVDRTIRPRLYRTGNSGYVSPNSFNLDSWMRPWLPGRSEATVSVTINAHWLRQENE
jgi:hypothetical protein